jgi:hypothetical protein
MDRKLGGPQNRFGRGGEEKNSQPLPGLEPPIIQLTAQRYTAELSRLFLLFCDTLLRWYKVFISTQEINLENLVKHTQV